MFQELYDYYKEKGILATSFTCEHKERCGGNHEKFTGPKSAYVSTGYEKGKLPRLLFLSLDSGSADKNDRERLPEAVRRQEEKDRDVLSLPKNRHWYRTHELAWYILKLFKPGIKIQDAKKYFAHANSAKCCMNKPGRKKADSILFTNCREYLQGELKILRPDIIVTQGAEAKKAVGSFYEPFERIDKYASTIRMNSRKVFWLHTYHPAAWGAFNKQRNFDKTRNLALGWDKYSCMIHEFVEAEKKQEP